MSPFCCSSKILEEKAQSLGLQRGSAGGSWEREDVIWLLVTFPSVSESQAADESGWTDLDRKESLNMGLPVRLSRGISMLHSRFLKAHTSRSFLLSRSLMKMLYLMYLVFLTSFHYRLCQLTFFVRYIRTLDIGLHILHFSYWERYMSIKTKQINKKRERKPSSITLSWTDLYQVTYLLLWRENRTVLPAVSDDLN